MIRQDEEDVQPAQRRHRQVHRHRRRVELHQPVDARAQRPPALMDFVVDPNLAVQGIQVRIPQDDVVQAARRRQVAQNRQGNQHQVPENGLMDQNRQVGQALQVVPIQQEPQIRLIEQNNQLDQNLQVAEIPGPPHARHLNVPLHLELLNRFMQDYAQQRIQVPYPAPPIFPFQMAMFIPPGQMMGNANFFMPPPFYVNSGHPPVLIQGQFYNIFVQVPNFPVMGPPNGQMYGHPGYALPPAPVVNPFRLVNQYPVLRNPEQQHHHHGNDAVPANQIAPERDERRNPVVDPVQQNPIRQDEPHALPDVSRMEIGTWQSVPRRLIPGLRRTYPTAGQNFEVTPWNGGSMSPSRQPDLQGASSSSQSTSGPSTSNPSSSQGKPSSK
uniref:Ring finger protein n=1 Tax=Caenorhabditis tropicalis TaxID=1561998 RepID=A0A1I7TN73_9PELO